MISNTFFVWKRSRSPDFSELLTFEKINSHGYHRQRHHIIYNHHNFNLHLYIEKLSLIDQTGLFLLSCMFASWSRHDLNLNLQLKAWNTVFYNVQPSFVSLHPKETNQKQESLT